MYLEGGQKGEGKAQTGQGVLCVWLCHSFAESLQATLFSPSPFLYSVRKERGKKRNNNSNSNNIFLIDLL